MIDSLLHRLADRLPGRVITEDGTPYLERYFLLRAFGLTVYLHRFVGSDPDRGLHDHPWRAAASLVLSGPGYIEATRFGMRRRKRFGAFTGGHFHRVILINGIPTWTLFVHTSARVKTWGFWRWSMTVSHENVDTRHYHWTEHASADNEWWRTAPIGRYLEGRRQ